MEQYRVETGCGCGWRQGYVQPVGCCPECGLTFLDSGGVNHDFTYKVEWFNPKVVWYKPATWRGYWKRVKE